MNKKTAVLAFLVCLAWTLVSTASPHIILKGAGATFPYPLYSHWIEIYQKESNVLITYEALGSGNGIKQLTERTVDFGATDACLTDAETSRAPAEILHVPTCVGAVAVTYNLPHTEGSLKLTPELIAGIFLGTVKRWSDKRIAAMNPDFVLPDLDIRVVHRSDVSGTTFIFTNYLSRTNTEWKERIGYAKSVKWPVGMGVDGNSAVVDFVRKIPGSIGYGEHSYARNKGISMASIRNEAGHFIEPTLQSISAASRVSIPKAETNLVDDGSIPEAYPLSGFTYIIVYREQAYNQRSRDRVHSLAGFLWWMIHEGQSYNGDVLYAPLSSEAVKKAESILRFMTFLGKPITDW